MNKIYLTILKRSVLLELLLLGLEPIEKQPQTVRSVKTQNRDRFFPVSTTKPARQKNINTKKSFFNYLTVFIVRGIFGAKSLSALNTKGGCASPLISTTLQNKSSQKLYNFLAGMVLPVRLHTLTFGRAFNIPASFYAFKRAFGEVKKKLFTKGGHHDQETHHSQRIPHAVSILRKDRKDIRPKNPRTLSPSIVFMRSLRPLRYESYRRNAGLERPQEDQSFLNKNHKSAPGLYIGGTLPLCKNLGD